MIKPFLSGIFAGLLSLSTIPAHAEGSPTGHLSTGNTLLKLLNGPESERPIAVGYVLGFYEALDEVSFCTPAGFSPRQAIDVARKALEDAPEIRHYPATVLLQAAFEVKFPCKESKKPSSSKNGKDV